jgi:hypothetical protein
VDTHFWGTLDEPRVRVKASPAGDPAAFYVTWLTG